MNLPERMYYWLGKPCQYNEKREDLDGLPQEDLGGRDMAQPPANTPEKLFDATMPAIFGIHAMATKQAMQTGKMPTEGWLAQAFQVMWCFTSREVNDLRTELLKANQRIAVLEAKLEGKPKTVDAPGEGH